MLMLRSISGPSHSTINTQKTIREPPPVEIQQKHTTAWMTHLVICTLETILKKDKIVIRWATLCVSSQHLSTFGALCPITDVQLLALLWAIASHEVLRSKSFLHAITFVMFARKELYIDLHSLVGEIPIGFVTIFLRQGETRVFGHSGFRPYSNHNVNIVIYDRSRFMTALRADKFDNLLWYTDKWDNFAYCVVVGTPKHDTIFVHSDISLYLPFLTHYSPTSERLTQSMWLLS